MTWQLFTSKYQIWVEVTKREFWKYWPRINIDKEKRGQGSSKKVNQNLTFLVMMVRLRMSENSWGRTKWIFCTK